MRSRTPERVGWTIAGVLAHLAFWDARAVWLMDRWESGVVPSEADDEPEDVDWINDAAKPLCLALPPRDSRSTWRRMWIGGSRRCRTRWWRGSWLPVDEIERSL